MAVEEEDMGNFARAAEVYKTISKFTPIHGHEEIMASSLFSLALLERDKLSSRDRSVEALRELLKKFPQTSWAERAEETLEKLAFEKQGSDFSPVSTDNNYSLGFMGTSGRNRQSENENSSANRSNSTKNIQPSAGAGFNLNLPDSNWKAITSLEGIPGPTGLKTIYFDTAAAASGLTPVPNMLVIYRTTGETILDKLITDYADEMGINSPGSQIISRQSMTLRGGTAEHIILSVCVDGVTLRQEWMISLKGHDCWLLGLTLPQETELDSAAMFKSFSTE
jgi:hypothetical protein